MKRNSTVLLCTLTALLVTITLSAQTTGDYRSVNAAAPTGGNWNDITKWERFDGLSWVAAATAPTSADGLITIRTGDSIILNVAVTADQIVIESNAALAVSVAGNNLTLNNGSGDDLTVNGRLLLRGLNTINGPGNIVVNNLFEWLSGTIAAPTTLSASATGIIDLNFGKTINATTLTNDGTINWTRPIGGGGITFSNGATFTNNGTINAQINESGGFANGAGTNSFINNGILNKLNTGTTFFNTNVPFTNTGTIRGVGTLTFSGTISNTGSIAPGNSPGILTTNTLIVSGQTADIDIEVVNGSGAGTGHDRLDLTGNLDLSTLTLNVTDPGTAPLQAYTVLTTTGTFSNTFAAENVPSGFTVTYNATSVVVTKLSFPLPAVWGDFAAIAKGNTVALNWLTLQESNTSQFAVQHSTDGRSFKTVGFVQAKGNSDAVNKYNFAHQTPNKSGNNFYRLQLVDLDGKISHSPVRVVRYSPIGQLKAVVVTPNPVRATLNLAVQEEVEIKLTDLNGRILKTSVLGAGNHSIDVSTLTQGIYILNAYKDGSLVETQRIVKQ